MKRYWRYETQLLTSEDLRRSGIHPLRCINLGRCETVAEAEARGRRAGWPGQAVVIPHNVRIAVDSQRGAIWRLAFKEIIALRGGHPIVIKDSIGTFTVGYRRNS